MIRFVSDYRKMMHAIPEFDSVINCTNLITIDEEQDQSLRDSEIQRQVIQVHKVPAEKRINFTFL